MIDKINFPLGRCRELTPVFRGFPRPATSKVGRSKSGKSSAPDSLPPGRHRDGGDRPRWPSSSCNPLWSSESSGIEPSRHSAALRPRLPRPPGSDSLPAFVARSLPDCGRPGRGPQSDSRLESEDPAYFVTPAQYGCFPPKRAVRRNTRADPRPRSSPRGLSLRKPGNTRRPGFDANDRRKALHARSARDGKHPGGVVPL